jgi:hypothetical protein
VSPESRLRGALRSQCGNKRRYRDHDEAKRVRRTCLAQRPDQPLRIYPCPYCRGFHLTSQDSQ